MVQLTGIKRKAALLMCRILPGLKPRENETINPWNILRSSKSALICAPFDRDEFRQAVVALNKLSAKLTDSKITIIAAEDCLDSGTAIVHNSIIPISEKDMGFLKIPRKAFINSLKDLGQDTAIDLNPAGTLLSAIICAVSGAKVRIGFYGKGSERFFNFMIRPRLDDSVSQRIKLLLEYLS